MYFARIDLAAPSKVAGKIAVKAYRFDVFNPNNDKVYTENIAPTPQTDATGAFVTSLPFDLPDDNYTCKVQLIDASDAPIGAEISGTFTVSTTVINAPSAVTVTAV